MQTPLFIAFRYWRSKSADRFGRLVTNLASLGIVLGVMALIIVLSVMNGLEAMQKRNVLTTLPQAIVSPLDGHWQKNADFSPLAPTDLVQKFVPINRANVMIQTQQGLDAGVLIGVTNPNDDPLLESVTHLETLLPDGEYKVLISSRLAQKLGVNLGDKIRLMITENSQYTPFGRVPVQRLFTIAEIFYSNTESGSYTLFANLADVGRLLRLSQDEVQGVRLFFEDPFLVTELPRYFPESQWQINDWREQKGEFFQAVKMEKNMMSLLISLIIIVAISNIVTSLSLMVVDKQGEIAILQTQGLAKGQVMQIFIWQGAIVGVIGAMLGTVLGLVVTHFLGDIVSVFQIEHIHLPTLVSPVQVMWVVGFSILLSLICTLYPAYQAAKIEPAVALRYE